jgi:6-phosphogluconolactonase
MKLEIFADPSAVAVRAAQWVAAEAREAVAARGRFSLAVSGGHTPWQMLRALAEERLPWASVHLFQVDERVAPEGDPDRNLSHIRDCLLRPARKDGLPPGNVHAMPVNDADLPAAATRYGLELEAIAGKPPVLDVVHLGLGPDGHTASLVPGDPVLEVTAADVGLTGVYNGRVRMTLTYPVLDRARAALWLVTGAEKAPVLPRLLAADRSIPAGRVHVESAWVFADRAAAAALEN